jgi:Holliday junction resolvase
MNRKRKGTRNEYRSIRLLESLGYNCVRSSASKGVFDIVAISQSDILLLQVKTNDWPGSVEMESIKLFPVPNGVRKLIHRWKDRARLPDTREID